MRRFFALTLRIYTKILQALFLTGLVFFILNFIFPLDTTKLQEYSVIVTDYQGQPVHIYQTKNGYWRLPVKLDKIDPKFVRFLQVVEDKRFFQHPGIDPFALFRASWQLVTNGRIVSGGSTITMQTARLLEPRPRNFASKIVEMFRAVQLELGYSKQEILEMYLNLTPYGGNIQGLRAASLLYFGKEPFVLSDAEIALLIGLPQSPESTRPDRFPEKAKLIRDFVLDKLAKADVLTKDEVMQGQAQIVPHRRLNVPRLSPHLSYRLFSSAEKSVPAPVIPTSLDVNIQTSVEQLAQNKQIFLQNGATLAILVVENKTRLVRAYVGSGNFYDPKILGQNDMVRAIRSPGSTLKPLIYGIAFDQLFLHPETLINDAPIRFGDYAPQNFDRNFHGNVNARKALQLSLNIPAVLILNRLGPDHFLEVLKNSGIIFHLPPGMQRAGLPIALGGIGINLEQLVTLYTGFANDGWVKPLNYAPVIPTTEGVRLMGDIAAWYIRQILQDSPSPPGMIAAKYLKQGREVAFKTGTSYGFRDAWAIGYDQDYTVGVWVGRPDGSFSPYQIGREEAAPILFDVFNQLPVLSSSSPKKPDNFQEIKWEDLPISLKFFNNKKNVVSLNNLYSQANQIKIDFPLDKSVVEVKTQPAIESIMLEISGGKPPFLWFVNGQQIDFPKYRRKISWTPSEVGFARITVMDSDNQSYTVEIWLKEHAL